MTPSKHQLAVQTFVKTSTGNALISAVAGSGKTTTLLGLMRIIPMTKSVRFFAFGKDIAEDLKTRVPSTHNISVSTIHSYGMKQCMKHLEHKPELDDRKYTRIVDDMYIDMKDGTDTLADHRRRVAPLINLARVNMSETWEDVLSMSVKYDLAVGEADCRTAMAVIRRGMKELDTIDMTDMIWLPVALKMKVERFDFVMVDECQDLSELQRTLVLMSVRKGGRFIAVGDPSQAIFGFAGADVESFNKFKLIPNTVELPLSVCYRCPKEVIELAKTLVPHIEEKDSEKESKTQTIFRDAKISDIQSGDLILCRLTYPLVKLGFQYIAAGVKARIAGRDIGKNLISMIKNTKAITFDEMYEKFKVEMDKIESDLMRTRSMPREEAINNQQYTSYVDKVEAIKVVGEGCATIQEVIKKIDGIFSDDRGDGILLSTIHKAKGLEADNVYIIHDEMMPSKNAKTDWARVQEYNLMYVAYTRAKKKLGFVCDFDAWKGGSSVKKVEKKEQQPVGVAQIESTIKYIAGEVLHTEMQITDVKEIPTAFGKTQKYTMRAKDGKKIVKLGSMSHCKIVSGSGLKTGSVVDIKAPIKQISTFNGEEEVTLGMLLQID